MKTLHLRSQDIESVDVPNDVASTIDKRVRGLLTAWSIASSGDLAELLRSAYMQGFSDSMIWRDGNEDRDG